MLRYLPALGEHEPLSGYGTGLTAAAIGVTSGLRTSWKDVRKIMRGSNLLFNETWFKDIVRRPAPNSICLFDSGLYSVFGLVKKEPSFDLKKFFSSYAPAYKDYINYVLKSVPEGSAEHCFFVNLDTDFLFGLEKTREFNDMLLKNCPEGRIVGTYHAADGKKYLDELIEKFDYIAVADAPRFEESKVSLKYAQAACEYIKNKRPEIKIHVLGKSGKEVFRALAGVATTCDSSSHRFFGEPGALPGTNLQFNDFWKGGFNYGFCGGMEKVKSFGTGVMSDMKYSALITETILLYCLVASANQYVPQSVRTNCPVRDALDDMFGVPHSWWDASGGPAARYLSCSERLVFEKGKSRKVRDFKFLVEAVEGAVDLGCTTSEFTNKRKNDWTREAPRPENF